MIKKMIKNGTLIKCEVCGKQILAKMGRTLCIRCTNIKYKEEAEKRRKNPEYKQMYMEKYKRNDR